MGDIVVYGSPSDIVFWREAFTIYFWPKFVVIGLAYWAASWCVAKFVLSQIFHSPQPISWRLNILIFAYSFGSVAWVLRG